ncbi:helicase associated domain-containing protein [Streptomyces sp. NBC_01116]|uniref:helicase associated domain-containing protein n=1 Tax=Streptomyces sp. NBC_01116 TaxID=2903752 RepID=UPI003253D906
MQHSNADERNSTDQGGPHGPVRLGTWISNTRSRREKLTDHQREQLAALGIDWATAA